MNFKRLFNIKDRQNCLQFINSKLPSFSVVKIAFILSFLIIFFKGVYRHIEHPRVAINFFEREIFNHIFSLGGIPTINLLLIFISYFLIIILVNKYLNRNKDRKLWGTFIHRMMMPGVLAPFFHPIFFIAHRSQELETVLINIDRIIVVSAIIFTFIVIKSTYLATTKKMIVISLFVLLPFIVLFGGKVFCPYFLWLY